jgi:DNA-directed RNA polymerase specialized sigma24 family protein
MLYFYYEEMEIHEICAKLEATEDSVRSLLKRGRASMKEIVSTRMGSESGQLLAIAPYLKG